MERKDKRLGLKPCTHDRTHYRVPADPLNRIDMHRGGIDSLAILRGPWVWLAKEELAGYEGVERQALREVRAMARRDVARGFDSGGVYHEPV
jgi:hypothetical protein